MLYSLYSFWKDRLGQFISSAFVLLLSIRLSTYLSGLNSCIGSPIQLVKTNEDIYSVFKAFLFDVTISFIALNDFSHSKEEIAIVLTTVKRECR